MNKWSVQIRLAATGGNSADDVVNTFHVVTLNPINQTEAEHIRDEFTAFYQAIDGGMPDSYIANGGRFKIYNMDDSEPRAPLYDLDLGTLSCGTGTPLPREVALCVTWKGLQVSGVPLARCRGRTYLGPWLAAQNASTGRPTSAFLTATATACTGLVNGMKTVQTGAYLAIWSPTDGAMREIKSGYIDDEWDTQRRRGRKRTTTYAITPT